MNNDFSPASRELFNTGSYVRCWECGKNNADCLHHILGRVSNSPYNAAPLNNFECHQPEGRKGLEALSSKNVIKKYLTKTKIFLDGLGYSPNKKDLEFLDKYKMYYERKSIAES